MPGTAIAVPDREGTSLEIVELLSCTGKLLPIIGMRQTNEQLCTLADRGAAEIGNTVLSNNILNIVTLMGHLSARESGSP